MPKAGRSPAPFPVPEFEGELTRRLRPRAAAAKVSVVVLPDQLSLELGALRGADPKTTRVVLLESGEWLSRRPYHRQRLAWILLSQRKFALEAADAGFEVVVLRGNVPMVDLLRGERRLAPFVMTEPAERESRAEFGPLVGEGLLDVVVHDGFLTTAVDLDAARTSEGFRMDRFYQGVRKRTGILMEDGKPVGGKYSFDAENRRRWDGSPHAPTPPTFPATLIREEVVAEIETNFADHPGTLDISTVPAQRAEIDAMWAWAKRMCLPNFGPYEDAMSRRSRGVFHTRISPLLNLHRLMPERVVRETLALDLPIASKEGFVRQIVGWREFVYQVHRASDGFRSDAPSGERPLPAPGDGGFARWGGRAWLPKAPPPPGIDGGARPNAMSADLGVPEAWWGKPSGLACLDHVVDDVWAEGWSHHITRLMVLANLATLAGVSPRDLCDWFWIAYVDAWDWVVEPNVLGMATYGYTGMTTKPYVSGSAYLEKMGDSCASCALTPGKDCPVGPMYWAFLSRNGAVLGENPRMKLAMASCRGRTDAQRAHERSVFVALREVLVRGEPYRPTGEPSLFTSAPKRGAQ
ncbi:MAG: cryptochrome/photolyase family protein [Phycisphaerales bacterium]